MKLFVFDKYEALTIVLVIALVVTVAPLGFMPSVETAGGSNTLLPIYSVETEEKAVSLTFDCAWGAEDIDAVIEALSNGGCKATFFVVGSWAEKYPDAVKKLYNAGHEVANHSAAHEHFNTLGESKMRSSMDKCDEIIEKLTGVKPVLFRAPYGEYNDSVIKVCNETGRYAIQWDVDSLDWKGLTKEEMAERILPKIKNGSIILMHTGTENTAAALPYLIEKIKAEGYTFKKTCDMIYKDNFEINHEGRQIKKGM